MPRVEKSKQNHSQNLVNIIKVCVEELFEVYGGHAVKIEPKIHPPRSKTLLLNSVINFKNERISGTLEIKSSKRFLELTDPSDPRRRTPNYHEDWLNEFTNLLMGNIKAYFARCNINVIQDYPVSSLNLSVKDSQVFRLVKNPKLCMKISVKKASCWLTLFADIEPDIDFEEKNDRGIFIGDPGDIVLLR